MTENRTALQTSFGLGVWIFIVYRLPSASASARHSSVGIAYLCNFAYASDIDIDVLFISLGLRPRLVVAHFHFDSASASSCRGIYLSYYSIQFSWVFAVHILFATLGQ